MSKWRNSTTTSLKRWFRLPRWPRCDRADFDVYLDQRTSMRKLRNSTFLHSVRSAPSLLKYKQFTSVLRLKALSDVSLVADSSSPTVTL